MFLCNTSQRLTQLTGRPHPSAGTNTFSTGPVTGGSILTQAPLPTVCSVKPCRAFWEKNTQRKEHLFFYPSVTCWTEMTASLCPASTYLLCSWVRSSPACTHTVRWPGGRCRRYGSYSFGYILSHRTRMGTLPGEGQIM